MSCWLSRLLDFCLGAQFVNCSREVPLQYTLGQILLYFLKWRNFQWPHIIQPDDMVAKGGFHGLLRKLAFRQFGQGFSKRLDITCSGAPVEFAALIFAAG